MQMLPFFRAAVLAAGLLSTATQAGAPFNPTTGEQRTLVLLVNFQDKPLTPFSVPEVQQTVFSTVSGFFREVSEGRTWLAGDVVGWYTLPIAATCDTSLIVQKSREAATARGVDLAAYGRLLYVYAGATGCSMAGGSTITRYPSETVLNGRIYAQLVAHELGHAMGLYHSLALDCDAGVQEGSCALLQDDFFDVMGSSTGLAYPNGLHRERAGWLAAADVQVAAGDGTYTIAPYELDGTATPRVLKLFKDLEPGTGVPRWYYLEYRQPIGADGWLAGDAVNTGGILVRYGLQAADLYAAAGSDRSTVLLDMTPNSSAIFYNDRRDPALQVGREFADPASGLRIRLLWADGATAGVQVTGVQAPPAGGGSATGNAAPVAVADSAATPAGGAAEVAVLANDSDPDGDRLSVTAVSQPSQGSVTVTADGSVVYVASKGARRSDSFRYTVSDGRATATAVVSVAILKSDATSGGGGGRKR